MAVFLIVVVGFLRASNISLVSSQGLATISMMTTQTITSSSLSYSTSYSNSTTTLQHTYTEFTGFTLLSTLNATSAQFIIPTTPPCYAAMFGFIPTSSPIYISYSGANQVFELYLLSFEQNYIYTRYLYSAGPCVPPDATWHRSTTRPSGIFQVPLTVYNRTDWNTYVLLVTTRVQTNSGLVISMWPIPENYANPIMSTVVMPFITSTYVQVTMAQTVTAFETTEKPTSSVIGNLGWVAAVILATAIVGYFAHKSYRKRADAVLRAFRGPTARRMKPSTTVTSRRRTRVTP